MYQSIPAVPIPPPRELAISGKKMAIRLGRFFGIPENTVFLKKRFFSFTKVQTLKNRKPPGKRRGSGKKRDKKY
jgi:hypothetical protein